MDTCVLELGVVTCERLTKTAGACLTVDTFTDGKGTGWLNGVDVVG